MGGISKQLKRPGYGEGHKRLKFKKYAQRNADGTPKESVFHSDPTYLTFFLMFDWYGEHSPLFNGRAVEYLEARKKDQKEEQKSVRQIERKNEGINKRKEEFETKKML